MQLFWILANGVVILLDKVPANLILAKVIVARRDLVTARLFRRVGCSVCRHGRCERECCPVELRWVGRQMEAVL